MNLSYVTVDVFLFELLAKKTIDFTKFKKLANRLNKICGMRTDRFAELLRIGEVIWKV